MKARQTPVVHTVLKNVKENKQGPACCRTNNPRIPERSGVLCGQWTVTKSPCVCEGGETEPYEHSSGHKKASLSTAVQTAVFISYFRMFAQLLLTTLLKISFEAEAMSSSGVGSNWFARRNNALWRMNEASVNRPVCNYGLSSGSISAIYPCLPRM